MRVFTTYEFDRLIKKEKNILDVDLLKAVGQINQSHSIGGNLYKLRVASNSGQGKRGGSRVILSAKINENYFYIFAYKKNAKDNIDPREEKMLKILSKVLQGWSDGDIEKAKLVGEVREVQGNE